MASLRRAFSAANSSSMILGARSGEGSSGSNTTGWLIRPRATASICCSPPDSRPVNERRNKDMAFLLKKGRVQIEKLPSPRKLRTTPSKWSTFVK